jgi:TolB-like protein
MVEDLASLGGRVPLSIRTTPRWRRVRRWVLFVTVMSTLVVLTGAVLLFRHCSGSPGSISGQRKLIVVLPFENLGPPEDEHFANGTMDAITARLASISGLGVISRQSAMQYKKTTKTIRQIGNELGVDYILEGTVQRERPSDPTSRVRVIPQLIRVSDDTHVWADTYDENMTEVFRVQSDIAEKVAAQLDVALLEPERRAIERSPTENLIAYDYYLRGMEHMYSFGAAADADLVLSVQMLWNAVSLDPRFAEAWAGLAMAHHLLYWVFDRPGALVEETEAAKRAEELAPDTPETHLALGYVAYANREFDKALAHYEAAQRLGRNGDATLAVSWTMRRLGRWQDTLDEADKARRLIPRSYRVYVDALGETNRLMRRFDEAEQDLNEAISLSPLLGEAYLIKAQVLVARNGDVDAARLVMREMSQKVGLAEVAQAAVAQGALWGCALVRLFPDIFAKAFDTLEAEPMGRSRAREAGVIAATHLSRAWVYDAEGDQELARARYDSARVYFERIIRSNRQSAFVFEDHVNLGLAYAGLGLCEDAIREGESAVRMMPISKDAYSGTGPVRKLAEIYVKCGEYEAAIGQIETLLSVPSDISPALLRVDPIWDPLRSNPRFRRLVEGK